MVNRLGTILCIFREVFVDDCMILMRVITRAVSSDEARRWAFFRDVE